MTSSPPEPVDPDLPTTTTTQPVREAELRVLECADEETAAEAAASLLYGAPRQGGKTLAAERLRAAQSARRVAVRHWQRVRDLSDPEVSGSDLIAAEGRVVSAPDPVSLDAVAAAAREVLATHAIECTGRGEVTCRCRNPEGWMYWPDYHDHVSAAISEALAGSLRTAEDRAVLEAAEAWERSWPSPTKSARRLAEVVRARRVAAGGTEEDRAADQDVIEAADALERAMRAREDYIWSRPDRDPMELQRLEVAEGDALTRVYLTVRSRRARRVAAGGPTTGEGS